MLQVNPDHFEANIKVSGEKVLFPDVIFVFGLCGARLALFTSPG